MDCEECGKNGGTEVKVEYLDGKTETVELCNDCREDFIDAEFVAEVGQLESRGHTEAKD